MLRSFVVRCLVPCVLAIAACNSEPADRFATDESEALKSAGSKKTKCQGLPDGTVCDDGDACTAGDVCVAQKCVPGLAVVCAPLDSCHAAGVCNSRTGCSNPVLPAGTVCSDDGNPCTTDVCNATGACTHPAGNPGLLCRASAGACDLAETCDGVNTACPADAKSTATCRASAGPCDLAETCDGVSNDCPADAKSTAVCRASAGPCDFAETCDGVTNDCPADAKSTAVCRASAGPCDLAESCNGVTDDCPADAKSTAVCRASAGPCDFAETCDGVTDDCPADAKSTAVCRASAGPCDLAESCNGVSNACPADAKSTAVCRASQGPCDLAETCDGVSNTCPADAKTASCVIRYTCLCLASTCGNGAISALQGDVATGVPAQTVVNAYGPNRTGTRSTGWSCFAETMNLCTCLGASGCGNGSPSGTPGQTDANVTTANALNLYGILRTGTATTGWACLPSRVDSGADFAYMCQCVSPLGCGNGALSGGPGDTVPNITPAEVINLYGALRSGSQATGWACMEMSADIVECAATATTSTCGNGAPIANAADVLANHPSTAMSVQSYGVLQRGAGTTGWAATPILYSSDPCLGVTCGAIDSCHVAGACDPSTGFCSNPLKANGASCGDDTDACVQPGTCQAGVCQAGAPVCPTNAMFLSGQISFNPHMASDPCSGGACTGQCDSGFQDCNGSKQRDGCETNLDTSDNNCGACGLVCPAGQHCSNSTCG